MQRWSLILVAGLLSLMVGVPGGADDGEVRVPLSVYTDLVNRASGDVRPAPAGYALGKSSVDVRVTERAAKLTADVKVDVTVRVLESKWTLIPLLPPGTSLSQATVSGKPLELISGPDGLAWVTDKAGNYAMHFEYQVDARQSGGGVVLALPVPRAASTTLVAWLPGMDLDVAVVPATGVKTSQSGQNTQVQASVPAAAAVQMELADPSKEGHAVSRAHYRGEPQGDDAIAWNATFNVEIFSGETLTLPLFPQSVTLSDLQVDGKPATVVLDNGRFATWVRGRGAHTVSVAFEVPVTRGNGPPRVSFSVPQIPVSRFDLTLAGKKEVTVSPQANVTSSEKGGKTLSTAYVPLTGQVTFSWSEAIPEELEAEVQANASLYHLAHAEEGVLHVQGIVVYEITRGEASVLELEVPKQVQINSIRSHSGGVSDWRLTQGLGGAPDRVSVYLDRKVKGEFRFDVSYERLLGQSAEAMSRIEVPLLKAANVHRQRGMVALLSGKELALNPISEERLTKVGENQLPPFVREAAGMTIAHTYKYLVADPELVVQAAAPERKRGKYDAQVDTLISLGEVSMKGSATIELNVKTGSLMELELRVPADVNILSLTGPSLRNWRADTAEGTGQLVHVAFTQEMEGQFRIELSYEHILQEDKHEFQVPAASVVEAEVEHGRIAVEALTVVEVQAATAEQLSSVDVNELPQQLVLKTTNPILLAYKYVHAEPPFKLVLRVTRHKQIDVQVASIDRAVYRTLATADGLAVTTAHYTVRNSRKQFLRVELPPDSEVWSVFVNGKPEKPALAAEAAEDAEAAAGRSPEVLIKMINSSDGFPVEIVYATPTEKVGAMGVISGRLPRPDMVVTETRWDLFLPSGLSYKLPRSNMQLVAMGQQVDRAAMEAELGSGAKAPAGTAGSRPLRISVPTQGVHFAFEKLYANQSDEHTRFAIAYSSLTGDRIALALSLLGTLLIWAGIIALVRRRSTRLAGLALVGGLAMLGFAIGYLKTSPSTALWISVVVVAVLVLVQLKDRLAALLPSRRNAP